MALSFVKYTGDGVQTQWTVTPVYIAKSHISVLVDDVSVTFAWVNNTAIKTTVAAGVNAIVDIRRDTPIGAPLVDFEDGGTLAEPDLDLAVLQALYHNQEQADDIDNSIGLAFDQEWDAENKEMKNLAAPTAPTALTDAINIGFLNTALVGSGNVPVPLDPSEDGMTLIAGGGLWSWAAMLVDNLSDVVAVMKTFLKSTTLALARTNLGLGSAAVKNHGTGAADVPLNSDLGTASTKDVGTASGEVPMLDGVGMPVVSGNQMTFTAMINAMNWNKGTNIPSAATTDIGAATGNFVDITGIVTITALGTIQAGTMRWCRFTGAGLTITHNATSLILLNGADVATSAGDIVQFASLGGGNWVMVDYIRKSGQPPVGAAFRGAYAVTTGGTTTVSGIQIAIAFGGEHYDTDAIHDNITNNSRLTVPTGVTKVRLTGNAQIVANATGNRLLTVTKNGVAFQGSATVRVPNAGVGAGNEIVMNVTTVVLDVIAGDYFELEALQDSGVNLNIEFHVNTGFGMEIIE